MNLNYLIEKNHIFKRRKKFYFLPNPKKQKNWSIKTTNKIRFELVYFRVFKKLFRRKYYKIRILYKWSKLWMMVKPNFILTMKSKNSRMGSGVGSFVRVASLIKPNTNLVIFKNYSLILIRRILRYLKRKMNLTLYLVSNNNV